MYNTQNGTFKMFYARLKHQKRSPKIEIPAVNRNQCANVATNLQCTSTFPQWDVYILCCVLLFESCHA